MISAYLMNLHIEIPSGISIFSAEILSSQYTLLQSKDGQVSNENILLKENEI